MRAPRGPGLRARSSIVLLTVAAVLVVIALIRIGGGAHSRARGTAATPTPTTRLASSTTRRDAGRAAGPLPSRPPRAAAALAVALNDAVQIAADRTSSPAELRRAGLLTELAVGVLRSDRVRRRTTLRALSPTAAAFMTTSLRAARALSSLDHPLSRVPSGWRILSPDAPATLLADFHAAQARTGVTWATLAAIELVETRMGRLRGRSSAGAQGPMQFEPGTWAIYGHGSIDNQRDAVLAAARLLAAHGAPRATGRALLAYNDSSAYVAAVQDYAHEMSHDPAAFALYDQWQVIVPVRRRLLLLPIGYPAAHAVPVG